MKKIKGIAVFFFAFSLLPWTVHADSLYEKAKEEGKALLYTSFSGRDVKELQDVFQKKYPGVTLEVFRAGGPKVLQRIMTEHRAGSDFVDVVMTKGDALYLLHKEKLLAKWDSENRKAYDDQFKDPDGYWLDVYPTVHSIAYNTKMVSSKNIPRHYTDLLKPRWKEQIGLNTNNFMFLYAMLHLYGKEKGMDFLKKLATQKPQVRTGGTLTATLVAAGEFPLAVSINANNIENIKEKGGPVDWARLEDPMYADLHPVAVMAKAPRPNAARLFADFVTSKEGQLMIKKQGRVTARRDVEPKIAINRSKLRIVDPAEGAKTQYYEELLRDLYGKAK